MMDALDRRLLDDFQRDFPLVARPYAEVASRLGSSEAAILERLAALRMRGLVSRVGAVFRPHSVGASTLAALAVPVSDLERVAAIVSGFPEVNHNYEREHAFSLWFVVAAPSAERVQAVLAEIAAATGYAPLDLPMVEDFHIDLGFHLWGERASGVRSAARGQARPQTPRPERDLSLVAAINDGLPCSARPFADAGAAIGMPEDEVLTRLKAMLNDGTIRRFGIVVRHHELGFTANAMVVWDIPDDAVAEVGRKLASNPDVTLCYRRPRRLPDWPYNLFCMIHGRDRSVVQSTVEQMVERHALHGTPHRVLFSGRRFKQCGALYGKVA